MGIDLTICPEKHPRMDWFLAHERLGFDMRDYELFDRLREKAAPLSKPIDWYGDEGIEKTTTDPYGDQLTTVTAHALATELAKRSQTEWSSWDRAIYAFVVALPPDVRIVLWWH